MREWIVKNSPLLISTMLVVALMAFIVKGVPVQGVFGLASAGPGNSWISIQDASVGTPLTSGVPAFNPYWYNGTNYDSAKGDATNGLWVNVKAAVTASGTKTPSDAFAIPTDGTDQLSFLMGFNGATYDRMRSIANNADGVAVTTLGIYPTGSYLYGFNGTTYDRVRTIANNADGVAASTLGNIANVAYNYIFNGTTWDRLKSSIAPLFGTEAGVQVREVPNQRSRAPINISATGDQTLVAGVGGQTITVYKINVVCVAANTVIYKDGVAGTAINGAGFSLSANGGWAYDGDITPIVLTLGNAFVENDSAVGNCSGFVIYSQA